MSQRGQGGTHSEADSEGTTSEISLATIINPSPSFFSLLVHTFVVKTLPFVSSPLPHLPSLLTLLLFLRFRRVSRRQTPQSLIKCC